MSKANKTKSREIEIIARLFESGNSLVLTVPAEEIRKLHARKGSRLRAKLELVEL